jgi:hypothetical protein
VECTSSFLISTVPISVGLLGAVAFLYSIGLLVATRSLIPLFPNRIGPGAKTPHAFCEPRYSRFIERQVLLDSIRLADMAACVSLTCTRHIDLRVPLEVALSRIMSIILAQWWKLMATESGTKTGPILPT